MYFSAQIHGLSTPAYIGGLEVGDVLVSNNICPSYYLLHSISTLHCPGECGRAAGHPDDPPGDREPHQGGGGRAEAGGGARRPPGP